MRQTKRPVLTWLLPVFSLLALTQIAWAIPGDLNCDDVLDINDVDPFVLALIDPVAYTNTYPTCSISQADMNGDVLVDGADIQLFITALLTPPATGACCAPDGTCTVTTEADCSGTYHGDGTDCSPNPCPQPEGACCAPDGSCSITTQADCSGTYQGDWTDCDPNPCPLPQGACCDIDGTCTVTTEADCSGTYHGDGTDCSPNPCPQPEGACCAPDGSCSITTQAGCSGTYQGDWTDCDPNPCPLPEGACCAPDATCTITTEAACTGQYAGDGTSCSPNPCTPYCPQGTIIIEILTDNYGEETSWTLVDLATSDVIASGSEYDDATLYTEEICVPYAGCYTFTINDTYGDGICCGYGEGYYRIYYEDTLVASGGDFDSQEVVSEIGGCTYEGSCCFDDGSCTDGVTEADCEGDGGTFQGTGATCATDPCPQPGACCHPDGTCSITLETSCDGVWQGPGTNCDSGLCADYGACCNAAFGTCTYVVAADCADDWQGAGTVCDPNSCPQPPSGACCLPDGNCVDGTTEVECLTVFGTYQGHGVSCTDVECPEPASPTMTQLAGNPLSEYPYFEYVKAYNEDAPVHFAIDPTRFPGLVGHSCDIYVVEAKSETQWMANPSLVDARISGPQTETFSGSTIQANTFNIIDPYELSADAGIGLGVGYDVIIDVDNDGLLSNSDYIDGLSNEAGLYLVHDVSERGPLNVSEVLYSGGSWLGQNTYYPNNIASMGQLPLIVVSHGNGHDYRWYDHIGYHMASYGYIVMSHQNNTGPGIETASTTTLTNTDYIIGNQATIQGGVLNGHIDSHRITWIGHSRGAEGITRAYDRIYDGTYTPTHYTLDDIVFLSSMLPVDFLKTASSNPHEVNYHLWTASGDDDVNGSAAYDQAQTYHLHERATRYRMSTTVQGTGHGDFHAASGSVFSGPCHIEPKSTVHDIMNGLFLPMIKHYVEGNIPATDFFWRQYERFHPISVDPDSDPCIVVSNEYRNGSEIGNFIIDNYETNTSTNTSSSGGSVTYTVENLTEGRLDDNNSSFSWTSSDPFNGATQDSSEGSDNGKGVVFDWNGANRYYEWEIIPSQRDLSDDLYLSFRGAQGTQHPYTLAVMGDLTFSVTLRDSSGTSSSINIGAYGGGFEQPYDRSGGWHNEMEVIKIRLTDFLTNGSSLDLSNIVAIRLDVGPAWGSNEGRIVIDEMMITNDVPPAMAGAIAITEIDSPSTPIPPDISMTLDVQISAIGEEYVPGSGTFHYRLNGGAFTTSQLVPQGSGIYRATLPALTCDDAPEYYFSAVGTVSGIVYLPIDAPGSFISRSVGTVSTVFSDNFETDTGWVAENLGATSGDWQRGVPVDDDSWDYDPPLNSDGSGQCWLTQNEDGNTDVDDGAVRLTSPTLNLSNPDFFITYDYYLFLSNSDGTDRLLVEIDNGSGTWTEIARHDSDGGTLWRSHEISRADILSAGVTPTDICKLRFTVNDGDTQSVVEAGLDAFAVTAATCED